MRYRQYGHRQTGRHTRARVSCPVESIRNWFSPLNPYGSGESLLKIEDANFSLSDPKVLNPLILLLHFEQALCAVQSGRSKPPHSPQGLCPRPWPFKAAKRCVSAAAQNLHPSSCPNNWASPNGNGISGSHSFNMRKARSEGHQIYRGWRGSESAVIRYAVTTTDLWHGFDRYNAGKPYHCQVRPFGSMVMFQQKESVDTGERTRRGKRLPTNAPTMLRVIAPFNRNPAVAARHAFDRDTGVVIPARQLKSYASALRHYHNHPEAKFLNGERADRGPTTRRHVIARSIRHIGKEANRLDEQQSIGIDPTAQAEFGSVSESRIKRLNSIRVAADTFGPSRVAREAGISLRYLFQILNTETAATEAVLSRSIKQLRLLKLLEPNKEPTPVPR